jgi:F1F0 ATPase subunit 2
MSEILFVLLALLGGLGLGAAFFGSLSWTTKRLARFQRPVLTMLSLFFLRVGAAVFCFVWLIRAAPLPYAEIFLIGFLFMQILFLIKRKKAARGES